MQVMEPAAGPFPPPCREGLECKHDEPARYLTDHLAELGGRDQNTDRPASELFGAPGWAEKSASVHGGLGRSGTWKPPPCAGMQSMNVRREERMDRCAGSLLRFPRVPTSERVCGEQGSAAAKVGYRDLITSSF